MGLAFFPRGGSAHVARNLACALGEAGWDVTVLSGSITHDDEPGDARQFYRGLDVRPQDFTRALEAPDPMRADPPMHPSYEDRPGAPDRVFASLDDAEYERQVTAWGRALQSVDAANADVLHLHHLTPIHEAAARVAPGVPVVGHLHGPELLMLEAIAEGPPAGWEHAEAGGRRMRRWALGCERLLLLSHSQLERAERLLGIDPRRCVIAPNGFDPERFSPRTVDRAAFWRHALVDDPPGWGPGHDEGSVAYRPEEAAAVASGPVLLSVSRFTEVKRLGLLVRAFARTRAALRDSGRSASLVLVGGYPGEWEGEHPYDAIRATGARDVYLAGWHEHDELPKYFAASAA